MNLSAFSAQRGMGQGHENIPMEAATGALVDSSSCFTLFGWDACCSLVLIRTNSSITEMSSSFKTKGEIFRKIFNFIVKWKKYYLFISIIRAKTKHISDVCEHFTVMLIAFQNILKLIHEAPFTFPQLPLQWVPVGRQGNDRPPQLEHVHSIH